MMERCSQQDTIYIAARDLHMQQLKNSIPTMTYATANNDKEDHDAVNIIGSTDERKHGMSDGLELLMVVAKEAERAHQASAHTPSGNGTPRSAVRVNATDEHMHFTTDPAAAMTEGMGSRRTGRACTGGTSCSVCLNEFDGADLVKRTRCRHVFHATCLDEWLDRAKNTCPYCRQGLAENTEPLSSPPPLLPTPPFPSPSARVAPAGRAGGFSSSRRGGVDGGTNNDIEGQSPSDGSTRGCR
jgi:hypothetical protein